ncbi:LPS export ABC transporter periplasmic protein LptC [Marinimicrobium sp. C6131]|uniref:LPS export ABC transporter periplasmic protein LptC n=1 Tax=Marinimicrobium sp. C6131 TaxID=3022676 RepID=UPI00223E04D0|nr:LPS export ABC transporter periplasmic protein LptC [Marinimicrobium sp. C6131]UZJ44820.1 LPS export ABC transporter periplasmic protein LptC [Marinimicrobium sp. C6131]
MWKHPLTWVGLFLLIALVAVWDYSPEDLLRAPPETQARFPQAFMIASETRRYDPEGQLQYRMLSARADHFQHLPNRSSPRDYSLIQAPDVTVFGEDALPWQLTARLGRSDATGETLVFTGDVRAWQQNANGITDITTPELQVEPNRQFAQTDKAVTMRSPQGRHDAVGMRADLAEDHIELLSEVRGTYEPPQGN